VADFSSVQLSVFLDKLGVDEAYRPSTVEGLDKLYSLNKSDNAEIKLRFFKIALQSGPEYAQQAAGMFLHHFPVASLVAWS
jgi:leukotriene-A4 hydrolase